MQDIWRNGVCPTLRGGYNGVSGVPSTIVLAFHQNASNEVRVHSDGTVGTITAGSSVSRQQLVCYAFKFHQGKAANGIGFEEEVSQTLIADFHNHAVVIPHG